MLGAIKSTVASIYFSLFKPRTQASVNGLQCSFIATSPGMHTRITRLGGEKEQIERFVTEIKPGDVVWDVGSYIGMFSMFASKKAGGAGSVYAFEPEPSSIALIRKNAALNQLNNINIIEGGASNEDSVGKIYPPVKGANAISSLLPGSNLQQQGIEIHLYKGDNLVANKKARIPNVIKMDVEGAEYQALSGMQDILRDPACRFMFLELHPHDLPKFGASAEQVLDLISQCGFKVEQKIVRGTEDHLFFGK